MGAYMDWDQTMARPPIKAAPPANRMVFGAAAGHSSSEFYVVGYCHELDELEIARNPAHEEFTWIYRFLNGERQLVARLPQRVNDLWMNPLGIVFGVGRPRGVLEITGLKCTQLALDNLRGTFSAIWGTGEEHLFACGSHDSFLLYRRSGNWSDVPLPENAGGLWSIAGANERDVYSVSDQGEILHFDGRQVVALDSPTTRWLTCVAPIPGGRICISGYDGILLYGNQQGWRFVNTNTDEPLLNLAPYRGGVCFVTQDALWWFDGISAPQLLARQGGRWVNGLGDAVMIVDYESAWLFDGAGLVQLDTAL